MDGIGVSTKRNQTISTGDLYKRPHETPGLGDNMTRNFQREILGEI